MESSKWQTQLSTVRERTQYAFKNSLFCDVKFNVVDSANGEKVTIPANKYMLAVSSPVFEAMFYGDLNEKQETIDLPDCTKEGLQELLRFVHSDEVNLTGNNVMEVFYLAVKYIMPFLSMKCREYVKAVDKWATKRIKEQERVLPCKILKKNELIELLQIYGKAFPTLRLFNTERRQGGERSEWMRNRFREITSGKWHYSSNRINAVSFSVSKATSLFGVRLFGSQGSAYEIELKVLQNDQTLSRVSSSFKSDLIDDRYYGFAVTLDGPVSLELNVSYTLWAKISGPPSQYGESGQCIVDFEDLKIKYTKSSLPTNYTSVDKGQFPGFLLSKT